MLPMQSSDAQVRRTAHHPSSMAWARGFPENIQIVIVLRDSGNLNREECPSSCVYIN